jgi:hypothetical protein
MYCIQRRIDQVTTPAEWETKATADTAAEAVAFLCDRAVQANNPAWCGRDVRVIDPAGREWDRQEFLWTHV